VVGKGLIMKKRPKGYYGHKRAAKVTGERIGASLGMVLGLSAALILPGSGIETIRFATWCSIMVLSMFVGSWIGEMVFLLKSHWRNQP